MVLRCGSWLGIDPGVWPGCPPLPAPLTPEQAAQLNGFAVAASELLDEATCHRFGSCPVTLELCNPACGCVDQCGCVCRFDRGLSLARWAPIASIDAWTVAGVPQPVGDLQLVGHTLVVGPQSWASGTTITVTAGAPPPAVGVIAAANLAVEWWLRACGDDRCRLPDNIASATGPDGGTLQFSTLQDLVAAGLTGVAEVDLFLSAFKCRPASKSGDPAAVTLGDMPWDLFEIG